MVNSVRPDVNIGTETWLNPTIGSAEIIRAELGYTIYRKDRPNMSYEGVMIAVSNDLISTEATELDTECEVLWIRINLFRAKSLYIGAFYRPPDRPY